MTYVVINPETGEYLGDACSDDFRAIEKAAIKLGGVARSESWVERVFGVKRPAHVKFLSSAKYSRTALKEQSTWIKLCARLVKRKRGAKIE